MYDRSYRPADLRSEYDRGYPRNRWRTAGPWVGSYRAGYQGGSEGVALGTGPRYVDDLRGTGYDPTRRHEHGYRRPRGADFNRSGERLRGEGGWRRLEEWAPTYSPVGGMHPAMGGRFKYRGEYHRGTGYDGWYNQRTRWF